MTMLPAIYSEWWANLALDVGVIVLAMALDQLLPEPPARLHPVVWMGRMIGGLERLAPWRPAAALAFGALGVALVVTAWGALAWLAMLGLAELGVVAYLLGGATLLRTSFTVRGLLAAGESTCRALESDDIGEARARLQSLVSRDRAGLSAPLVAASAIESVAENTTDSYIAPWLAFAVLGPPLAVAYRATNTLDSMWGKRGRYEYLGKCAARFDDLVNYVPARLSAGLMLLSGALIGLPVRQGWRVMRRDRGTTESPNAGWTMSAMAGLLGRWLEKPDHYDLGAEFPLPEAEDIARGNRVAKLTAALGVIAALGILALRHWIAA
ncbi:MAG: cobalamin biosynthesis protein CobD [Chloroflexi bacterium]|nr:cobalamin biosynthesis protein CobD [Chloroflexota bacterium]MYF82099.1 cobalamin biosynthesis protein CobD [Chloroflexota bacterium]MYI03565.1 cobalamin biosynthesis protein CobD [Chloroflexota bacterium]